MLPIVAKYAAQKAGEKVHKKMTKPKNPSQDLSEKDPRSLSEPMRSFIPPPSHVGSGSIAAEAAPTLPKTKKVPQHSPASDLPTMNSAPDLLANETVKTLQIETKGKPNATTKAKQAFQSIKNYVTEGDRAQDLGNAAIAGGLKAKAIWSKENTAKNNTSVERTGVDMVTAVVVGGIEAKKAYDKARGERKCLDSEVEPFDGKKSAIKELKERKREKKGSKRVA